MSCVSCDIDYACTTFGLFVFSLGYSSAPSRVTGACPVLTTDLIMRVNVRTTTTSVLRTSCLYEARARTEK